METEPALTGCYELDKQVSNKVLCAYYCIQDFIIFTLVLQFELAVN
jgi:hypothetical protein